MPLPSPLLFIADLDEAGENLFPILQAALKGGCRWVLLRGVKRSRNELLAAGLRAKSLCANYDAKLFISRDAVVAKRLHADGLHLSANTRAPHLPGMMIGQSCHNAAELHYATRNKADYVFLSPVFTTQSKPKYGPALGLPRLKALAAQASMPVCALGGITPQTASDCLKAGAKAVAVMGGILRAKNPEAKTRAYLDRLK